MTHKDNKYLFERLRKDYPTFTYSSFDYEIQNDTLKIIYDFNISDKYFFSPEIQIKSNRHINWNSFSLSEIKNLVFNMGMVELVSYWKATCSPNVIIKAGSLNEDQIGFWKKLYYHGLGEFYYLNNIDVDIESALEITTIGDDYFVLDSTLSDKKVLVPIGGGKDSIVTLELLSGSDFEVLPLIVNPRPASWRTIETAGYSREDCLVVNRSIDKQLLELNKQGFLNGHTPFSAMIAFTSAMLAYITSTANIALSNESSANDSTVPGSKINHQYSKSFEFEDDFYNYSRKYLIKNLNYFSFLRPLNELQIAKLFSGFKDHYYTFRSCNVGSKEDSWCGKCPKCMFTYIILSPFIDNDVLKKIFGKDMLEDLSLASVFKELTGISYVKPFECVGTPDEIVSALNSKYNLNELKIADGYIFNNIKSIDEVISEWNNENRLSIKFLTILKSALNGE